MPRQTTRGRAVKRDSSQAEVDRIDQEEQQVRASTNEIDLAVQQDGTQQRETRFEEPSPSTPQEIAKATGRRGTRKRQKIEPTSQLVSEFVEMDYANQIRQKFSPQNGLAGDLPPIHDLNQIFEEITRHAVQEDGFKELLDSLNGRPLRVATMCSGTESPILALELVVSELKKMSIGPFSFKQLFSAEIVEHKQAYIERNFHPPILFRDVLELSKEFATTAYGAKKKVPTQPDLLIVGFPCVDYSMLNNFRKKFGERGESNDTFKGLVAYCKMHKPKLIIIENVSSAPWVPIQRSFQNIGYYCHHVKVDTKDFYIPQTRERSYALCIDNSLVKNGKELLEEWGKILSGFQRRASSPFTEFIDADDNVIEQRKLERAPVFEPKSSPTWSLYKIRHADVRRESSFGNGRPITGWEEGGKCCPPTWMDRPWFFSQVERVWDTIDANHLRVMEVDGSDSTYKVRCIDLSQGVDRDVDSRPSGIMGCVTPSGLLYCTSRGGQIQGRELLAMQGLPLSRLSLTRESQSQMQDLAGNAMSTTVVGSAMLAALIVCHMVLKVNNDEQRIIDSGDTVEECMPAVSLISSFLEKMRTVESLTITTCCWLTALAGLTSSLCSCEGQYGLGLYGLYRCLDCNFTACAACKENPIHNYTPIPVSQLSVRRDPKLFRELLLHILPSMIRPPRLPIHLYQEMSGHYPTTEEIEKVWKKYLEAIELVCQDALMFVSIKRRHIWNVVYEGIYSTLHLAIGPHGMHWTLFAKAPNDEPAGSYFREVLRHPIAKMEVFQDGTSVLEGKWKVYGPLSRKNKTVTLKGVGDLVPSYESVCGLPNSAQKQVWSNIIVGGEEAAMEGLSMDIRGHYQRISNCGGALQSLHRRSSCAPNEPDLFLFLDPRVLGPSELDSWVFSTDPSRKVNDTWRDIVLQLDSKWSYQDLLPSGASSVLASHRQWIDAGSMAIINCDSQNGLVSRILDPRVNVQLDGYSCYNCYVPLLSSSTNVEGTIQQQQQQQQSWEVKDFREINELAWAWAKFSTWSPCPNWKLIEAIFEICERCSPEQPKMAWIVRKGKERPIEDPVDAARCERDYKTRPSPFCLFEKTDGLGNKKDAQRHHFCLALNLKTLLHRAFRAIAHRREESATVEFYWRITNNDDTDIAHPSSYRIVNNNGESGAVQPPHFMVPLRLDQLRSLRWALSRESTDQEAFLEEEVEEAILDPMNWRAEAKVLVHRTIRGGVLADHVGFGKTAVVLGLIDSQHEKDVIEAEEPCNNAIPLKATCIVVPDILFDQWRSEIVRFLGDKYTVLEIRDISQLHRTSIKNFQTADIVLVAWTIFTTASYFKSLEEVAGGPCPPKMTSRSVRMFEAWSEDVLGSIEERVTTLQMDGPEAFLDSIHLKRNSAWGTGAYTRYLPSRKIAGKGVKYNPYSEDVPTNQADGDVSEPAAARSPMEIDNQGFKSILPKDDLETYLVTDQNKAQYRSRFGILKGEQALMKNVKGTVFHMYRFQRLVIDEFTYLNQDRHALLVSLKARSRWIMSGTPPIKGFAAAERMARLVGVYLGRTCDEDYEKSKFKRSESENFHFFREVPSRGWHFRRNGLAQHFCDVFMRQNTPEIPQIEWTVHYEPTILSAVERILYLELKVFYESYNPQTTGEKKKKYAHDQRGRISEIVDTCDTPEQSIVKRSSYYDALPKWSSASEKIDTAEKLVQHRRKEIEKIIGEIKQQAKAITWLYHQLYRNDPKFSALQKSLRENDYGDTDVSNFACRIIDEALTSYRQGDWEAFWYPSNEGLSNAADTPLVDVGDDEIESDQESSDEKETVQGREIYATSEYVPISQRKDRANKSKIDLRALPTGKEDKHKELREWTNRVRVNIHALVDCTRGLRFAQSGCTFVGTGSLPICQSCGQKDQRAKKKHSVLGKCGHIVCASCLAEVLSNEKCTVLDCRGAVDEQYVIPGSYFAMCQPINMPTPLGGSKVEALIKLLKDESSIPKDDQVILFLQFQDLQQVVTAALELNDISYVSVGKTGKHGRGKMKKFSANHDKKVAILQLGTENAAGLNLQNANHVIFFAPFAAKNHYEYQSTIAQSSGRVIRFGQKKKVHIWNLATLNTLEVGILQGQDGRVLVRRPNGKYELVLEGEVGKEDVKGFDVPAFDWK
ncbi:SNF2 family helicase, putative [Talaromyces stipitatus ATCC 10500]|uniref:SNF2 family helicase, putative n=1 Tax=Talaromyces stipitatus (strain ATCC 10500 / CBS 375.48 / QM 6759 / NRRL 1006) TaxID=441959 RepID=B8LT31_TALSN|nr:SNF2 family helicase, putative [Talaromyces stipitatus ATCC 10500]EED23539.1 SNF2 family helicase, putative [Talaromyces stipitatus ATCC 10500]